jgi:hypothetical protein
VRAVARSRSNPFGDRLNIYFATLKAAVQAVGFLSDTQFTWFGAPSEPLSRELRLRLPPETAQGLLWYQLRQTLYHHFYTKGTPQPALEDGPLAPSDARFEAMLASANRGAGSVETDWTAHKICAGRVMVERQGLTLDVPADACLPPVVEHLVSPIKINLRVPNARPHLSPGYYVVVGDFPVLKVDDLIRLYWHPGRSGALGPAYNRSVEHSGPTVPFEGTPTPPFHTL